MFTVAQVATSLSLWVRIYNLVIMGKIWKTAVWFNCLVFFFFIFEVPTTQTGHNLEATVSGEESLRNHTPCQHNNPTDVSNKLPAAFPNITVVRHRSGPGQKPSRTILYFFQVHSNHSILEMEGSDTHK